MTEPDDDPTGHDMHERSGTTDRTGEGARRLRRLGAVVGSLAVAGGLAGGGVAIAATATAPVPTTTSPSTEPTAAAPPATSGDAADEQPTGVDYTDEQYAAFWGAGYTTGDVQALADLWATDALGAKARAGQALLDGRPVPVAPGAHPEPEVVDPFTAYLGAGYTFEDAVVLADLWSTDVESAKVRISRAVLDGEVDSLPLAPGTASAPSTAGADD